MKMFPEKKLSGISRKKYGIIVGIPSYNNADTIVHVIKKVDEGIKNYFGGNGLIVNADGGSKDGTREVFMQTDTNSDKFAYEYEGIPGKGSAMGSVLELCVEFEIPVAVFVDSDLRSIDEWWIERLTTPILEKKASYVTPYYIRHKYDGTITNNICYPLTSALYGKKVRQPIGGDFGLNLEMANKLLQKPCEWWKSDIGKFGIDIFMTTVALNESEYGVYQAALGAKIHDAKDPGEDLGPMFSQVVGTLFKLMDNYKNNWKEIEKIEDIPIYGEIPAVEPEAVNVNYEKLHEKSTNGIEENMDFYKSELNEDLSSYIIGCDGRMDCNKWVEIIFEFEKLYNRSEREKTEVIKALIPLYFSRVADFVVLSNKMDSVEAEDLVDSLLGLFLKVKAEYI